ncbi:MAG: thioredoxin family protein [Polyangiaceae bacterium]
MKRFALVPISIALVACGGPTRSPAEPPPHGDARIADPTPVQHTDTDLAFQGIHMEPPEFIEDDYAGALAKAKAAHVPLFVDSWATWCHSCLSMKQFVFTSPIVGQEAPKFVWLSIDTENTKNAAFLAKFPNNAIPTLRVIDPSTENATWTWEGTMTAAELAAALEHVRGAVPPDASSALADRDAEVMRLYDEKKFDACASEAAANVAKLEGTKRVDIAVMGTTCALELPRDAQQKVLPTLVKELEAIVNDPKVVVLADDRSSAYEALVDAGEAAGEKAAVHENAAAWAKFLEGEAAKAKTPAERAVFDPHRLLAYLAMGQPARAIPMLEQSQKDFPGDFNPPARLARAYTELGKYDEAVAASDRALALAQGPRRVRIELGKADAQEKKGDKAGEKKTLDETLAFIETLPAAQRSSKLRAAVLDRLQKLGAKKP